ncbi:AraC family transcriptional regulator [Candidatus Sneabacter namystus]|uniref:GyrI-like domain-containing protein n=1 Tax=Candidatus Sneabacter namystus TaxID=2601646 RepID=A0A5C0ULB2_9RICK|nr:GyrI-like domain-containing protein [Candidatus Sneabacter namystus]QEK39654.1 GyrI-like domain-containing protein [Candidatus Sneabacter namystus]
MIDIITMPKIKCATVEHIGDFSLIGEAFDKMKKLGDKAKLLNMNCKIFGFYTSRPCDMPVSQLRSMAGFSIEENVSLEGSDLEPYVFEGGKYATVLHKGPYDTLRKTYEKLFGELLPASKLKLTSKHSFEEYLNNPHVTEPSQLLTKIGISVE